MIKCIKTIKKAGFTPEQQENIINLILNEINNKSNIEEIKKIIKEKYKNDFKKIKNTCDIGTLYNSDKTKDFIEIQVKNTTCKYTLNNDIYVLINFLHKIGAVLSANNKENKLYNKFEKLCFNNEVLKSFDFYTDTVGACEITFDYMGILPDNANVKNYSTLKINDLISNKLIKLDNFNKIEKMKFKNANIKGQYCIFYKNNDNYIIINQKYFDLFKNDKELKFFMSDDKVKICIFKNNKIVGVIMALDRNKTKLTDFDLFIKNKNIKEENIIFNKQVEKLPDDVMQVLNETKEKMMASSEYKEIKNKTDLKEKLKNAFENENISINEYLEELEQIKEEKKEHKNIITGHVYSGNNAELLEETKRKNNFNSFEWVGSGQARKLNKQVKKDAHGVLIKVYYIDDDGRTFCKFENVYNVEELEEIQKVEKTEDYKNMIERLKAV